MTRSILGKGIHFLLLCCLIGAMLVGLPGVPSELPSTIVAASLPDLTVTSVSFNPPSAAIGQPISVTFTARNNGGSTSGACSYRVSLATTQWGVDYGLGNFPFDPLAGNGGSRTVTITTNAIPPSVPCPGNYYVTVFIDGFQEIDESDNMNNIGSSTPIKLSVSCAPVLVPDIRTPIDSISFGSVSVGNSSDKTTTIYNDGGATLTINSVVRTSGSSDFVYIGPSTPFTVGSGGSKQVTIRFTPSSASPVNATFTVNSNDPDEPAVTFTVSGNGTTALPDLTVTSVSFSPSSATIGQQISVTFTAKNNGGSASGACSYRVSLATTQWGVDYGLGNFPFDPLAGNGGSRTVTITTNAIPPSVPCPGNYYVTVFIDGFQEIDESDNMNNIGSSTPIKLSVNCAPALVPDIRTPIDPISFGSVSVGNSSDKTTTIYNDGGATLTINSVVRMSGSSDFAYIGPTTPFTIGSGGGSKQITIRFTPSSASPANATFIVFSNDPDASMYPFTVSGNGTVDCWTGSSLTSGELAALVIEHFPDGTVPQTGESIRVTAYAVARAESGGNPTACGDGGDSIGLWQINMPSHPEYSKQCLLNAACNAQAALAISSNGTNWNPWCTWEPSACSGHGNESYKAFLPEARNALGGMEEICNGIDDDGDGQIDEGLPSVPFCRDADGDSFGDPNASLQACAAPPGYVPDNTDCDDSNANVSPGNTEAPCNGLDDDCNPATLDNPPDRDGDGVTECGGDCDDYDQTVYPGAAELCDGKNNDCDGQIDEGLSAETFYRDADKDGWGDDDVSVQACALPPGYSYDNSDCDDNNVNRFPGAPELLNGIDDDCDGQIDEGVIGNHPPTALASDISEQPKVMYPDTEYTVTANYYDPDGLDDLSACYLQLRHPTKRLTVGWSQSDNAFWPYGGEEGANYLTVTGTSTPIHPNGYEITWKFKIKNTWPEAANSIDFGVFASDDQDAKSGWDYDDTNASFYRDLSAVEQLDAEIDKWMSLASTELRQLPDRIITNAKALSYFSKCVEEDQQKIVLDFLLALVSFTWDAATFDPGKLIHFRCMSVLSIMDEDMLVENYPVVAEILEKAGGINEVLKAGMKFSEETLKAFGEAVLKEAIMEFSSPNAPQFEEHLRTLLTQEMETDIQRLNDLRTEAKTQIRSLSPQEAEAFSAGLRKLKAGNTFLSTVYAQKSILIDGVASIRQADEDSWTLQLGKLLWSGSMSTLAFAVALYTGGFLAPTAIKAVEEARNYFFENSQRLNMDGQMAGLAGETFDEGFSMAAIIYQNVYQALEDIKSRNLPCTPSGHFESITNQRIVSVFRPDYAMSTPLVVSSESMSNVWISKGEACSSETEYFLVTLYEKPYTSFRLFQGVERTYDRMIPIENKAEIAGVYAKVLYEEPPEEGSIDFYLFGKNGNRWYGLDHATVQWNPEEIVEEKGRDYFTPLITSAIETGKYEDLSIYYDEESGRFIYKRTEVGKLESPGEIAVYDSEGRITGLIDGESKEQIPNSIYDQESKCTIVLDATGPYHYEVAGTEQGTYGLTLVSAQSGTSTAFCATDIPTLGKAVHEYLPNWDALSRGENGVTVRVDSDGDDVFEESFTSDSELTADEFPGGPTPPPTTPPPTPGPSIPGTTGWGALAGVMALGALAVFMLRRKRGVGAR